MFSNLFQYCYFLCYFFFFLEIFHLIIKLLSFKYNSKRCLIKIYEEATYIRLKYINILVWPVTDMDWSKKYAIFDLKYHCHPRQRAYRGACNTHLEFQVQVNRLSSQSQGLWWISGVPGPFGLYEHTHIIARRNLACWDKQTNMYAEFVL